VIDFGGHDCTLTFYSKSNAMSRGDQVGLS
jgi:hypothetical protein